MTSINYPRFSRIIRAARKSKQLSEDDMAKKIGVDFDTYHKWDAGEDFPDDDNLVKLNQALFGRDSNAQLT